MKIDKRAAVAGAPMLRRVHQVQALGLLVFLAGYASPAIFKDPANGQVHQFKASTPGMFPIIAQSEINNCAAAYERMSWKKQ